MGFIQHYLIVLLSLKYIFVEATDNEDTIGYAGMVSSTHYRASEAGKKILAMGGTAADAAVAVQMVLNVLEPSSSGIGGGAFIMYYDAKSDKIVAIDGREEAPNAFNPYVFCANIACYDSYKNNDTLPLECHDCDVISWPERSVGGLGIGVPGTFYAYKRLWEVFGAGADIITWSDLFTDAINIGKNGFIMYEALYNHMNSQLPYLSRYNSTCKLLLNYPICSELKYNIGDTVYNTDLANTFTRLSSMSANDAINEFYNGDIGSSIIETIQSAYNNVTQRTGLLTKEDLSAYTAVFREPISNTIEINDKTYDIYGMNMPSSGPLTVQYELKLLQHLLTDNDKNFDLRLLSTDRYSADTLHYLFSIGNIAFADRNQYMADQDFVDVPIAGLQNDNYLKERVMKYLNNTVQKDIPIPYGYPEYNDTFRQSTVNESGTAHICVVDRFGNVASITTSIEGPFGSRVAVDGYGFFLNNELTDFSSKGMINDTQVANGAEGGKKQRISALNLFGFNDKETYGGKRPRSSMSPIIVFKNNKPYLAIGGRGGSSIISNVFNIIARHLLYDVNIQTAINDARAYSFNLGNGQLRFEKSKWEERNSNITNRMVSKFKYDMNNLLDYTYGSCNGIVIGDENNLNMLHCGVDKLRKPLEGCSAVCNSTGSNCPFAITTMYPSTTADIDNMCSDNDEYRWIIKITLRLLLIINPNDADNEFLITSSFKRAFLNSIYQILKMKWFDEFCFDLKDKQLIIKNVYDQYYEVNGRFEYNDDLQNKVFSNDTLFDMFDSAFNEELIRVLIKNNIINADDSDDVSIIVNKPIKYSQESAKDHIIEGSLINAVVIISLINILIFVVIVFYISRNTKGRADIEGNIGWKDAIKQTKGGAYGVVFVEIFDSVIHWVFAIIVITYESYLGWILVCLLLIADIVLYIRCIVYKKLILYQIPQLLNNKIDSQTNVTDAIRTRKIDVGLFGLLVATVEDIPVIIIAIITGENFGYNTIEIIALIMALISICMKVILLIKARFGPVNDMIETDVNKNENVLIIKSIELAEDVNEEERQQNEQTENKALNNTNINDNKEFIE